MSPLQLFFLIMGIITGFSVTVYFFIRWVLSAGKDIKKRMFEEGYYE